jgi:hypothetical protein
MITILFFIWQLPQHLLAMVLGRVWKPVGYSIYKEAKIYWINKPGVGMSLGNYIFLDGGSGDTDVKHEYGHSLQSRRFGWFYLLIVGLPSMLCNSLWDRLFHGSWENSRREKWYYLRWPEKQADGLGGVTRYS